MEMHVQHLEGKALNWAGFMARSRGSPPYGREYWKQVIMNNEYVPWENDWESLGLWITRHQIELKKTPSAWCAKCGEIKAYGSSPGLAVIRCYIILNLGDVIEVPDEFLESSINTVAK